MCYLIAYHCCANGKQKVEVLMSVVQKMLNASWCQSFIPETLNLNYSNIPYLEREYEKCGDY